MNKPKQIAVLIDGDNADSKHIGNVLNRISTYGHIVIKRVYGDFSKPHLNAWQNAMQKNDIEAIHHFSYTKGKNSTDIQLIIDAMDILHNKLADAFCIVSSDCDFTGIMIRARRSGLYTIGVGKKHTCESFRQTCDTFIEEEKVNETPKENKQEVTKATVVKETQEVIKAIAPKLPGLHIVGKIDLPEEKKVSTYKLPINKEFIRRAFESEADPKSQTVLLSRFAESLKYINPIFDHTNYGYSSFRALCESLAPEYIVEALKDGTTLILRKTNK